MRIRTYRTGGGNQYWKAKVSLRSPLEPSSEILKNRRYAHATKNPNWMSMYGEEPRRMTAMLERRRYIPGSVCKGSAGSQGCERQRELERDWVNRRPNMD